jgi:hypothetical protein
MHTPCVCKQYDETGGQVAATATDPRAHEPELDHRLLHKTRDLTKRISEGEASRPHARLHIATAQSDCTERLHR